MCTIHAYVNPFNISTLLSIFPFSGLSVPCVSICSTCGNTYDFFFLYRDRDVIGKMVSVGAVECLVSMMVAEHSVMQIESLLALTLVTAIRGLDSEPHLVSSRVGLLIFNMVQSKPQREVFQNLLAFISQLATSSELLFLHRFSPISLFKPKGL